MHALLITQWYPPEPGPARVPATIAHAIANRGIKPTILTGFPNYPTGVLQKGWRIHLLQDDFFDGIRTIRVPLIPSHGAKIVGRILNYLSFGVSAAVAYPILRLFRRLERPDAIWLSYSPVTVGLSQLVAQLVDRAPVILWVGDLWPDTIDVSGVDGARGIRRISGPILHWWCNLLYQKASAVIVISPGVSDALQTRGVPAEKIHYIPVSSDEGVFHRTTSEREQWDFPKDRRILIYAGSMGAAQELSTLISAASIAGENGPLVVMAGSGTLERELRDQALRLNAPVRFLGRVPEDKMSSLLASGDAAYIGLAAAPLSAITMPSKTQSILASGCPVICCADGDLADLISRTNSGWTVSSGNAAELAQVLCEFNSESEVELSKRAENASSTYHSEFQTDVVSEKYERVLKMVVSDSESIPGPNLETSATRGFHKRDAVELAKLHKEAFPNFFLSSLGVPFLRRFYNGFALDPTSVSIVYRKEGKIIGVAVGTTQPDGFYSRLLKRDPVGFALAAAIATLRQPRSAIRLMRGFFYRGNEATENGQGLLSSICVSPSAQGQGLGQKLTEDFVNAMKRKGAKSIILTTDADDNESVNRLYIKTGWKLHRVKVTPEGRRMNHYIKYFHKK